MKNAMNAKNTQNTDNQATKQSTAGQTVEVLYQKMGDRWFAFSLVDDEVFVGSISQQEIDCRESKNKASNV